MNVIKWIFIIVTSLFTFVFLTLWFFGLGIEAIVKNESPKIKKQLESSSKQIAQQVIETSKRISNEVTLNVPQISVKPKEATIQFSEPKRMASEKLCNEAILVAMSDNSKQAQQAKKEACKPD